jgi:hypothetical protein
MDSREKPEGHPPRGSVEVYFLGSLAKKRGASEGRPAQLTLEGPTPLHKVLRLLSLERGEVQMAMVNHRAVALDLLIRPGDRLALFPKEYPLFADWAEFKTRKD